MSAHTPGPWSVGGRATADAADDFAITVNLDGKPHIVAEAYGRSDWEHEHPAEANAHLIAAAPDMLAALEGVVRVADRATDEFDVARAAIKKARGEA